MSQKTQDLLDKTKAQIDKDNELRAQYKFIRKATNIDDNGIEHVAYFKEPNRLIVGVAMAEIETNVLKACEYIFNDAVIKEISDVDYFFNNNAVFVGIHRMLQGLIEVKKSTFTT